MEEDIYTVVPCSSLAAESVLRIGTAGAIWELYAGPHDARKQGLSGITKASYVAKSVGKSGFQCGLIAGVLAITRCEIQRYRKQNDWKNSLIAGAVTGAVFAAGTRNWKQVIAMACIVSASSAAGDISRIN